MKRSEIWIGALCVAMLAAGCRKEQPPAEPATAAPANTATAPGPPTAAAPAQGPAEPAPANAMTAAPSGAMTPGTAAMTAAPPSYTLPAGTRLHVRLSKDLSTGDVSEGDAFSGRLTAPVVVQGATVFGAGQRVAGVVTDAKSPGKFKGEGVLSIRLTAIGDTKVRTSVYTQVVKGKGKRTAGFIGGGTGLGAIIGGVAGGGKGAAIGAIAGAGAGTAGGAMTGNKEVVVPAETVITFRLAAAKTVP